MTLVYTLMVGQAIKVTMELKLDGFPTFVTKDQLRDLERFASPYFTLRYTDDRNNYEKIYEEACEPLGYWDCTSIPQPVVNFYFNPAADVRFDEVDMVVEFTLIAQKDHKDIKQKFDPVRMGRTFNGAAKDIWSKDFATELRDYVNKKIGQNFGPTEMDRITSMDVVEEKTKVERLEGEIMMIKSTITLPIMESFTDDFSNSKSKSAAKAAASLLAFASEKVKALNPFPGGLFAIDRDRQIKTNFCSQIWKEVKLRIHIKFDANIFLRNFWFRIFATRWQKTEILLFNVRAYYTA